MIKTFKGILNDGAQEQIRLSTKHGKIGYKIHKFNIIPNKPVTAANECVIQIWKVTQSTTSAEIDFSDSNLLGVGIYSNQTDTTYYPDDQSIIFDSEIFNQDIYLTLNNATGSEKCNYYLELEVMTLSDNEATVSTLMDIRGSS